MNQNNNAKIMFVAVVVLLLVIPAVWVFIKSRDLVVEVPTTPVSTEPVSTNEDKSNLIVVTTPLGNATVTSPFIIEGKARGTWYFEASFPIKLYDSNGALLGIAIAKAEGDWMTEEFVPFLASLQFTPPTTTKMGMLVLEKDNPSGLVENDNKLEIPVRFEAVTGSQRKVKIYYYNPSKDMDDKGNVLCSSKGLVAVERFIPFTSTPIQDAIKLLFKGGITQAERQSGITTEYPLLGVELKGAALNNDVLTLNVSDPNNRTSGGSCRVSILRAQIEATARQFAGISSIGFINGELFQP